MSNRSKQVKLSLKRLSISTLIYFSKEQRILKMLLLE